MAFGDFLSGIGESFSNIGRKTFKSSKLSSEQKNILDNYFETMEGMERADMSPGDFQDVIPQTGYFEKLKELEWSRESDPDSPGEFVYSRKLTKEEKLNQLSEGAGKYAEANKGAEQLGGISAPSPVSIPTGSISRMNIPSSTNRRVPTYLTD